MGKINHEFPILWFSIFISHSIPLESDPLQLGLWAVLWVEIKVKSLPFMKTEAFSGNIGKVSNLKVFIRELFSVYAGAN